MKKLLIAFAAAGLFVGCAHNEDSHPQGATSNDSGMMQGQQQGSGAEALRNLPSDQGGTSSQSGSVSGNNSSSSSSPSSNSQDIHRDVTPNTSTTPSDPAIGVTPGAAVK